MIENFDKIYDKMVSETDMEYQKILEDDDIKHHIKNKIALIDDRDKAISLMKSISEKMHKGFFFAFEHAATRNMGLSLFSINDELRNQQALLSKSLSEGASDEVENVSKQITELEKRYGNTIKQINSLSNSLKETTGAITLAERERAYYEYRVNKKEKDHKKDIKEERSLIIEKVKENKKLGLDDKHGLQDTLKSLEHEHFDPIASGDMNDKSRMAYLKKLEDYKQKKQDYNESSS